MGDVCAVNLRNLSYTYQIQQPLIQNLSLQIQQGERVGLIGPNGAGKTTLFLLLCGILIPTEGEIFLFGCPQLPGQFNPKIGLVFQNPNDQLFCPTVRDDVAFGPENMGLSPEIVSARVTKALQLTGMLSLADRTPQELSGGEKCMVAIATILAMEPQLVLYDEPSANLDLRARRRLIEFLLASPQTYLLASHDLELVLEVCDRVILLDRGKVIADGLPREILGDERLMTNHALEVPYSLRSNENAQSL